MHNSAPRSAICRARTTLPAGGRGGRLPAATEVGPGQAFQRQPAGRQGRLERNSRGRLFAYYARRVTEWAAGRRSPVSRQQPRRPSSCDGSRGQRRLHALAQHVRFVGRPRREENKAPTPLAGGSGQRTFNQWTVADGTGKSNSATEAACTQRRPLQVWSQSSQSARPVTYRRKYPINDWSSQSTRPIRYRRIPSIIGLANLLDQSRTKERIESLHVSNLCIQLASGS